MKGNKFYLIIPFDSYRFSLRGGTSHIENSDYYCRFWIWGEKEKLEYCYHYDYVRGILKRVNSGDDSADSVENYEYIGYESYPICIESYDDLEGIKREIPPELFL